MTAPLFSSDGLKALRHLAVNRSLLSFDLDGTLAPIVARPGDARVSPVTAARLRSLARRWPIAVITGRAVADARPRLGFEPHYLVGNHGAERAGTGALPLANAALDTCRAEAARLAWAFDQWRVDVEDKGASLAWHYRRAADVSAVRVWLDNLLRGIAGVDTSHGLCVLNITPVGAPNKGDALIELMRDCGASRALVVGDDVNDEPAFARVTAPCVSVRIGPPGTPTCARFSLTAQSQVNHLLSRLLNV